MQTHQVERNGTTSPATRGTIPAARILVLVSLVFGTAQAQAETQEQEPSSGTPAITQATPEASNASIMVEVDPMPFGLSGHAVHIRVPVPSVPGLVLSAGTYSMEFPDIFTDMNSENSGEGWRPQIDRAYAVFADYHFSRKPEGLFVGTQLAYQDFELERDQSDGRRDFGVVIAMARVGTLWQPFDSGFYVLPWAGVYAAIRADDDDLQLGNDTFDVAPVSGFATLHVGWQL